MEKKIILLIWLQQQEILHDNILLRMINQINFVYFNKNIYFIYVY